MGVAAVVAIRVLRLEKRSLRHIVRAVSVYERERERERERESEIEISGHTFPFVVVGLEIFPACSGEGGARMIFG